MNRRSMKCTDAEIFLSLCSDSDTDSDVQVTKIINQNQNKTKKRNISLSNVEHEKQPPMNSTAVSNKNKQLPGKSLKMKLRRSTEQSLYKVHIDSDYERSPQKIYMSTRRSTINDNAINAREKNSQLAERTKEETLPKSHRISKLYTKDTDQQNIAVDQLAESPKVLRIRKPICYKEISRYGKIDNRIRNSPINSEQSKSNSKSSKDSDCCNEVDNTKKKQLGSKRIHALTETQKDNDNVTMAKVIRTRVSSRGSVVLQSDKNILINRNTDLVTLEEKRMTRSQSITSSSNDVVLIEKENEPDIIQRDNRLKNEEKTPVTPKGKRNVQSNMKNNNVQEVLSTPKSSAMPRHNSLTPSMEKRRTILMKPMTPLQEARIKLHVNAVPKSLPCREEEFNNIFTFLEGKLMDGTGGCIYISGVPGTGKTATVNEVIRCLRKLVGKGQLNDFKFIEINGMKLSEPRQTYVQILKQLTGQTLTWEQAYKTLEKRFNKIDPKRLMTLLLVDELDLLCTKRQDVVYNLLDWPTKISAQLVVITIANTMDLPERVLMGRVTSRLGLTRLTFQPYNHTQLQQIVMTRLQHINTFRSEAVQLVARKVSAVSGDARRALDICRRATEITELREGETVSMEDVNRALSEMITTAKVQAIKHCSEVEKIFLQAVCNEVERTGVEEIVFKNVYNQIESLCSFDGIKVPTVTETLAVCSRLGANRLLICEHSRADIYQRILLNVSPDDIHYALQKIDLD